MTMRLLDRLKATLRADAHGMIDALEDRALLLRQYVRDAEDEVARKRARLAELGEGHAQLDRDRQRVLAEQSRHDHDADLALSEGNDELARKALARAMPLSLLAQRTAERLQCNASEQQALSATISTQEAELAALRMRVSAFMERQRACRDGEVVAEAVTPDQVEIELLRRKKARRDQAKGQDPSSGGAS